MYKKTFWGFAVLALVVALCIWLLATVPIKYGIDLRGGTLLTYSLDLTRIDEDRADVANQIKDIISRRLNAYGMKEISVQVQGSENLIVRLPGTDPASAELIKDQIQRAGTMTFRLESPQSNQTPTALDEMEQEERNYVQADRMWVKRKLAAEQAAEQAGTVSTFQEPRPRPKDHIVRPAERTNEETGELERYGRFALENRHEDVDGEWEPIDIVSGGDLSRVYPTFDQRTSRRAVGFELKGAGAAAFGDLTGPANQGRMLCIVLDGVIVQRATIQDQITNRGQLTGDFSDQELKGIVTILRGGSLPTKPQLESETTIGSAIGADSLRSSFQAMAAALAAVLIFMAIYYAIAGIVADFALCLNVFFILAYVVCFRQDLTLPGVAGILLTIGMAVDANILIYERVREERKSGRSLQRALSAGYQRAFWVIFDSNLTTLLTGFVLFNFGTGPVRGFAITLISGIIASFVTSIFVTRLFISLLLNIGFIKDLKMQQLFDTPKIPFVSKQRALFTMSMVVIVVSWCVVLYRGKGNFGIDFNGGAQIGVNLNRPIEVAEMRQKINALAKLHPGLFRDFNLQTVEEESRGISSKYLLLTGAEEKKASVVPTADAQEREEGEASTETEDSPLPEGLESGDLPLVGETNDPSSTEAPSDSQPGDTSAGADAATGSPPESGEATTPPPDVPPVEPAELAATTEPGETTPEPASEGAAAAVVASPTTGSEPAGAALQVRDILKEQLEKDGLLLPAAFSTIEWLSDTSAGAVASSEYLVIEVNLLNVGTALTTERIRNDLDTAFAAEPIFNDDPLNPGTFTGIRVANVELVGESAEAAEVTRYRVQTTSYVPPSPGTDLEDTRPRPAQVEEVIRSYFNSSPESDEGPLFALSEPFSRVEKVSGSTARDLQGTALVAIFIAMLGIVFYISLRFEFSFGLAAVAALAHDVLVGIGVTAMTDQFLGGVFPVKINLPEIAAILTIIGFSINDTIVIFDRIRENLALFGKKKMTLREIVDLSINQTLSRTVWTSLTTLLVVMSLLVFGGSSVQGFAFIFCIGVMVGTYSSLFIACPIVIWLHDRAERRRMEPAPGGSK